MTARVQIEDSFEAVNDYLSRRRMTDGLPVVPPTEERVAAMVAGSGRDAQDVLGDVPPHWAPATVEKIAVNAVMAGCEPAYMPALIAAVEALLDPIFSAHSVQTTTNAVGPMIVFNGPIRKALGINCGAGCFGSGAKANATIGRALRLIMLNVGGASVGDVDKAVLGWPGKVLSCCIGENEEDSPYEPYHVERGFRRDESAVTLFAANGMWPITETSPEPAQVLHHVTHGMMVTGPAAGQDVPGGWDHVLVMSPVIAGMVAKLKPAKAALRQHIFETCRVPLAWYPPYRHEASRKKMAARGIDCSDGLAPLLSRPEQLHILVAGGDGGLQSCGISTILGKAVTRRIATA